MRNFTTGLIATVAALGIAATGAWAGVYFEDSFDGDDLAPEWQVVNPNPDAYLVENGVLTLLTPDGTPARYDSAENILRLGKPVPKGDWTMTARLLFAPQTMGESFRIGVARDGENSLLASFFMSTPNYARTDIVVGSDKLARGDASGFSRNVYFIESRDLNTRSGVFSDNIAAVELRLEKTGRNYVAAVRLEPANPGTEGAPGGEWLTVQKLTSLRAPGDAFVVIFGSDSSGYTPEGGEGLVEVDWVKIETAD
ncbi:MAG: hypothetical protein ACE5FS_12190 [Paracoccaceae bacterium]